MRGSGKTIVLMRCALVVAAFASGGAYSQIFRCTDADGHAVFSDTPCGSSAEKVEVVDTSGGLSPIGGDGLSSQEQDVLRAAAAANAQPMEQSAPSGAGEASDSYTNTAAWAHRRGY